jgi:hypothetical protein
MVRSLASLLCIFLATACGSGGAGGPTQLPARSETAPTLIQPSPSTPGLVIHGRVRLSDGTGLANVTICHNFASYSGAAIAVTDLMGYYEATFISIPGDEMIGAWALLPGYTFEPKIVRWRHYHGYEERTLDFVATPSSATYVPPVPCL